MISFQWLKCAYNRSFLKKEWVDSSVFLVIYDLQEDSLINCSIIGFNISKWFIHQQAIFKRFFSYPVLIKMIKTSFIGHSNMFDFPYLWSHQHDAIIRKLVSVLKDVMRWLSILQTELNVTSTEVIPARNNMPIFNFLRHSNYINLMRLANFILFIIHGCLLKSRI